MIVERSRRRRCQVRGLQTVDERNVSAGQCCKNVLKFLKLVVNVVFRDRP
jgi:hypothetical protein